MIEQLNSFHMIAFLIFSTFLLLSSANFPDSKLAEYKTINAKKMYQTILKFEQETKLDQDKLLCEMGYCHFEDRNNCFANCQKWEGEENESVFEKVVKNLAKATVFVDVADCSQRCTIICPTESCKGICFSLCSTHFSYDNREEYEKEFLKFIGEVLQDSKQNGHYIRYSKLIAE